ncbi:MAG: alpha-amylase family glycosyl hydrolase, partial [Bacteroidota bacterium]|nr:alpha-amylase family glycosyl hydrolase [Bacteroidota bacterium]
MTLLHAQLEAPATIRLTFDSLADGITRRDIIVTPTVELRALRHEDFDVIMEIDAVQLCREYTVLVRGAGIRQLDNTPCLRTMQSDVTLGCTREQDRLVFRLFAPRASAVRLHLFEHPAQTVGTEYFLEPTEAGIWQLSLSAGLKERYYCYRVDGPRGRGELFNAQIPVGDPYARAVVTANTWRHPARCVLPDHRTSYDWEGDTFRAIDPADLVIYELHVRDMTAHRSSGLEPRLAGTYRGLVEPGHRGGIDHLRALGVNAVELLPVQHFASIEPPYQRHVSGGIYNHWNPYECNHWGYMTSYFFTPEPRYAVDAVTEAGRWNTAAPAHLDEFRDMVKAFHRAGMAVIMDVVYNHTSQYDYQPLKYIDRKYYYRRGPDGEYRDASGCGNDLATEMPMARRLIVDSIVHWMTAYHIDGFRFDLAAMIDQETLIAVRDAARRINPHVILIAEPWGGGRYDLARFSELEMASWNDIFRNGVKGHDPVHGQGYIFGTWGGSSAEDFGTWMLGSVRDTNGPFLQHDHSVNYLESHDGYTLGDFIRIATGSARPGQQIADVMTNARLHPAQLQIAKLAAVMLCTARGIVMLHAGQEFARSKVVANRGLQDVRPSVLDHNSYEKDDETNWLDYDLAEQNRALFD